jgi:predicted nucleic acid-binding protein
VSGFLLDTSVISELVRPAPAANVTSWIAATDENLLHLSVLTVGEIHKGASLVRDAVQRIALETWLDGHLSLRFAGRILGIDRAIADRWARLAAKAALQGAPLAVIDGLLAATALHHDFTLVTRNAKDVAATGVPLLNPWIV